LYALRYRVAFRTTRHPPLLYINQHGDVKLMLISRTSLSEGEAGEELRCLAIRLTDRVSAASVKAGAPGASRV